MKRPLGGWLEGDVDGEDCRCRQLASQESVVVYIIAEPCIDVKDKACIEECPVDCIYEGARMLYIQPDECIDCAACEPVCPVDAISYEDDLPEEWEPFQAINAEFFSDEVTGLGEPGGAATVGPVDKDHPTVADWDALTA